MEKYNTDHYAKKILSKLVEDFREEIGCTLYRRYSDACRGDVAGIRAVKCPDFVNSMDASVLKRLYQLTSYLKRYRFKTDVFTDGELFDMSLDKFMRNNERLGVVPARTMVLHQVLQRARVHARRILGHYDEDLTNSLFRFGNKSSIGCPLSDAYLDVKLTSSTAFTSSSGILPWLNKMLVEDHILAPRVKQFIHADTRNLVVDHLNLVAVPKSWKALRLITPLTLCTLAYSYGVAGQVEAALEKEGLNIASLQNRHARLVKRMSVTRSSVTADLSSASDSLTNWLLNSVLPRDWYIALRKSFTKTLRIEDRCEIHTMSSLPMGNAATFPVETLVFYCLLKSISDLTEQSGLISAYGDDLIYPRRLHKYVSVIFPKLGILLNPEKTFVDLHFRESCGSDFFKGVDVRPAFLSEGGSALTPNQFLAWLHKAYNSLVARWEPEEIPHALNYLLMEMAYLGPIMRVPPSMPDESGIKVGSLAIFRRWSFFFAPVYFRFSHGTQWYQFRYLAPSVPKRYTRCIFPYYWDSLRQMSLRPPVKSLPFWFSTFESSLQAGVETAQEMQLATRHFVDSKGRKRKKQIRRFVVWMSIHSDNPNYKVRQQEPGSVTFWA